MCSEEKGTANPEMMMQERKIIGKVTDQSGFTSRCFCLCQRDDNRNYY